jgi:hypothetical protein
VANRGLVGSAPAATAALWVRIQSSLKKHKISDISKKPTKKYAKNISGNNLEKVSGMTDQA